MKKLNAKDWITLIIGYLMYLNYRFIYVFAFRRKLYNFEEFCLSNDLSVIKVVATVHAFILAYLLIGFWWTLFATVLITFLNVVVYLIWKGLKKSKT